MTKDKCYRAIVTHQFVYTMRRTSEKDAEITADRMAWEDVIHNSPDIQVEELPDDECSVE